MIFAYTYGSGSDYKSKRETRQKALRYESKGQLLDCKRRSFTLQKVRFYSLKDMLRQDKRTGVTRQRDNRQEYVGASADDDNANIFPLLVRDS